MLSFLYNEIFYKPLLNGLVLLSNAVPFNDIGVAIIILTLIVKAILFPLTHKSVKTQIKIKQIEPEIAKIKNSAANKTKQAEEILGVYRSHGISPYSGFLMLLIQLPILIALYSVFWKGLNFNSDLYSFISVPKNINLNFLGIFDITKKSVIIAFLSSASQFVQIQLSVPPNNNSKKDGKDDFQKIFTNQMKYVMPVIIFFIALKLPAAVSIYWTTMNIFAILHESIVRRKVGASAVLKR